ncbi:MAG TPA: type I glyceraldehyde-3-phosphate dehydrogenase [Acidimicrobiia bacterium]|jgi:glyceraldehyde 3-phosphate dehydrogenase|nr:type I glyceraldehyde-3-phosphate dehydrogenase [Acidimicrobiia bacterium]
MIRIAINGFGRIGRCSFKQFLDDDRFEVVGINDLSDLEELAYLLKYDSVHGWYPRKVSTEGDTLIVDGNKIPFHQQRNPADLPWDDLGVDVVVESSGAMRSREDAAGHLEAGAKRVVISAPSDTADATFVCGVNEDTYDPEKHFVVSNASCTTNCLAPVAKVLSDSFGVQHLMMSTIHAYTSSQALMDTPVRKRRRGRAAALSIIPTTTGAAKATGVVIPELQGKMDGMAFRVPVEDGSVTDITAVLEREVTVDEVHGALAEAADGRMKGILRLTEEELVSRDIIGDPHSSIVDTQSTMLLNGNVVKIVSWYDNEWGYSARMVDICAVVHTD